MLNKGRFLLKALIAQRHIDNYLSTADKTQFQLYDEKLNQLESTYNKHKAEIEGDVDLISVYNKLKGR